MISRPEYVSRAVFMFKRTGLYEGHRYVCCPDGVSFTEHVVVEIVSKDMFIRKFKIGSPYGGRAAEGLSLPSGGLVGWVRKASLYFGRWCVKVGRL